VKSGDPSTVLIATPGADLYGSDRMVLETVHALISAGYRVFATVPTGGPLVELLRDAGATVLHQPMPVIRKGLLSVRGLFQLLWQALTNLGSAWRLVRTVDPGTVLVNTITTPLWLPLSRVARRNVVCHIHEAESRTHPILRRALYLPLLFSNRIVVNSKVSLDVLNRSAPRLTSRAAVVPNAVQGPPTTRPARQSLAGTTHLVYVGRLSARKGPHVAIEAVRLLTQRGRNVHLTLVGAVFPGNEAYEASLHRQAEASGLSDRCTFLGFRPDVWPHLADGDIALVPSVGDESFGNTAVEASLAGRPVITSDIDGLREASSHTRSCVRVPPADPHALVLAVEQIMDQWSQFRALAMSDSHRLAQVFSPESYRTRLISAIGAHHPGSRKRASSESSRRYHTPSTRMR